MWKYPTVRGVQDIKLHNTTVDDLGDNDDKLYENDVRSQGSTGQSSFTTGQSGNHEGWEYDTSYRFFIKHRPEQGIINVEV